MYYSSFDVNITAKFGVVCEKWPLKTFTSPTEITTRNEVKVLFQAWKTGVTSFCRLSAAEWKQWDEQRFQAALDMHLQAREPEGRDTEGAWGD